MGRKKKEIPIEDLESAIKEYETQKEIANHFGVSQGTISNRLDEHDIVPEVKEKTVRDEKLEHPNYTYEQATSNLKKIQDESAETVGYDEVDIEIDTDLPILIIPQQDWHIGARYVDYKRLLEDINSIASNPQIFTHLNGDFADNYTTSSYKAGQIDQKIKIQDQKAYAETLIKRISPSILSILNGCFLEGTPVVSDDYTMKSIEDIDNVLGSKRSYAVKKHWENNYHSGKICRISYMGNTVFDIPATDNHPFLAIKRKDIQCPYREKGRFCKGINTGKFCEDRCRNKPDIKPRTVLAGDLEVGDFVYIPKPEDPKGDQFSMEDMEIFGWYLAEGSVAPERSITTFSFGNKDKEYVSRIQKLIEEKHRDKITSTTLKVREERNTIPLNVYGKDFAVWINKLCGRNSFGKKIHKDIINESNEKLTKLIDCFRLGDGHTRDADGLDVTLATISKDLAWQLWNILLRIGQFASIRQQKRKNRDWDDFQINYRPNRKRFRYTEVEDGYYLPITNIEKEYYEGIVKNLHIDSEEHLYRAGGCIQRNCHDEWSYFNDGFDFARYLNKHSRGYYMGHDGIVNLKVGEITYRTFVSHKTNRSSSTNPGHGLGWAVRDKVDFDVGVTAHHHVPHFEQRVVRGEPITLVRGGSYKGQSRNSSRGGFSPTLKVTPGYVLFPRKKKIIGHIDWKIARRFM